MYRICLILMLSVLVGCSGNRASKLIPNDFHLSIKRTPCFGVCPSYEVTVDSEGNVLYTGYSHTDYKGKWKKKLSLKTVAALAKLMQDNEFQSYERLYDDESISDLPSTIVRYTANNNSHGVTFRYGGPKSFIQLVKDAEALIKLEGFEAINPNF